MTRTIKQIAPCEAPIYAVYEDKTFPSGKFKEPIHFVGLTDSGEVIGFSMMGAKFRQCEDIFGFIGLYRERDVRLINDYDWEPYTYSHNNIPD